MTKLRAKSAILLAALAAAWQPSIARAADEDTQFWLVGFVRTNLDDDVFLTVDVSQRLRETVIGPDQQTFRVTVEKGLGKDIRLGGGFAIFETAGQTEFRPHQQFRFTKGGLDLRTRFEQRMFPGADRAELRIRQRLQYTHPASDKVDIIGSVEWFGIAQARNAARPTGTEQVRGIVAAAFDVGKGLEIQPGYLLWYSPREGRPDGISHVSQLTFNYKF
jgi:hypothetical protein